MYRVGLECSDPETSDRPMAADVLVRQEPEKEEEEDEGDGNEGDDDDEEDEGG
jgi:hypothetical protein